MDQFKLGDTLYHPLFGMMTVKEVDGELKAVVDDTSETIEFETKTEKQITVTEFDSEEIQMLKPNTFYLFGQIDTLRVAFEEGKADERNSYHFALTNGDTPCELTFEGAINGVPEDFELKANTYVEISVLNGYLTFLEWEVTE